MARKKEKSQRSAAHHGVVERVRWFCFVILLAGALTFAWLSLLSYWPTDPPFFNDPGQVHNMVGTPGACFAHILRHYFGCGVYLAMIFATVAAVMFTLGRAIRNFYWRLLGVAVLVVAISAIAYIVSPAKNADTIHSPSGVLGQAVGYLLRTSLHPVGSWIVLLVSTGIGLMLAADYVMLRLPSIAAAIWRSAKEHGPAVIEKLKLPEWTVRPQPVGAGAAGTPRVTPAARAKPAKETTTTAKPQADSNTAKPQADSNTARPQAESSAAKTQAGNTSEKPNGKTELSACGLATAEPQLKPRPTPAPIVDDDDDAPRYVMPSTVTTSPPMPVKLAPKAAPAANDDRPARTNDKPAAARACAKRVQGRQGRPALRDSLLRPPGRSDRRFFAEPARAGRTEEGRPPADAQRLRRRGAGRGLHDRPGHHAFRVGAVARREGRAGREPRQGHRPRPGRARRARSSRRSPARTPSAWKCPTSRRRSCASKSS